MATLTLRSQKGSPLTNQEVDDNFSNLNTSKLETSSLGSGTFGVSIGTAGATNTTVTWGTSTGFTANTSSNYTYDLKVGPALTNLAALMTTAGAGFIKRGATADTYTIDTNTYLTSESDTLASVTARGASTSTSLALTGTNPISLQGNSNNATYTQSVIYANQNNTSANDANGIFIERGRLADSASAEIRNFVIGARGGQIQWKLDGSGNTSQTGYASLTSNSAQLRLFRTDASGPAWSFYSWTSGLNIFPATASTIWIGRDGGSTDMQLYNGNLYAPIMYDTNNTGYYVDPASTSRFNDSYISTGTYGTRTNNSIFGGNMTGMGGASQLLEVRTNGSIPLLTWHYENIATRHIGLDSSGFLQVYNPGETGGSVLQANSSLRAPIFYDSNDTAYYLDPNSLSNIWALKLNRNTDHQLQVARIRGLNTDLTGDYIHMYERVHIGYPSGWGGIDAPSYGLSTWGQIHWSRSAGTSNWGYGVLSMDSGWGGTGNYPTIGSGGSSGSLIMLQNPHIPFRTDNPTQSDSGRAGIRMAIDTNASNWWDCGLYGDAFHVYRGASTSRLFYIDSSGNNYASSSFRAPIFYDSNDTSYYVDPNSTSILNFTRFKVSGYPIADFQNTNSSNYGLIEWTESGTHKTWMGMGGSSQSLGENSAYAQDGFSINHDGSGAFTISNRGGSKWIRLSTGDEGTTGFHTFNVRNGNVIINQNAISYSTHDNTPVVGGGATTNRLHVNGSIQLTNNDDAFVIGRGTATFLKDEELGFGWGGGWYMIDNDWVRVRNNKNIYTTGIIRSDGDVRAPIFYDQSDTSYYLNPAERSRLVAIDTTGGTYNIFRTWTDLPGYHGLYSSVYNGAHFYPNNGSYGAWRMDGSKDSWRGLNFDNSVVLMMNDNESGHHKNSYGWQFRWYNGTLYCYKNSYGGGTEATVLDSSNYTSYTLPIGGGWYGSGLPGSRWGGYNVNGGEISFGRDLPNTGQMGILVDGCYIAGENNGFWSLSSDNTWGSRRGMYWDGTNLNFTVNSPTASFTRLKVGSGNASSWIDMEDSDEGVRYLHNNSSTIGFVANDGNWSFRVQDAGNTWYRNRGWFDDIVMRKDTSQTMFSGQTSALSFENQSTFFRFAFNKLAFYEWDGSGDTFVIDSGYCLATTSMRAPIFYEYPDTGYYCDPGGTSNLHRLNVAGYGIGSSATIDLTGYDQSTYYPVGIPLSYAQVTKIRVNVGLNSGSTPSWSTHSGGFTLVMDWDNNGGGWGTTSQNRKINTFTYGWSNVNPCGGISQNNQASIEFVYLRGGGRYYIQVIGLNTSIDLYASGYSYGGQTDNPTTSIVNNVWDSANGPGISVSTLRATSATYVPIYYDSDATDYYLNAGTDRGTSINGFTSRTVEATKGTYKYNTPRYIHTNDTNYWTGIMGWGTNDLNTVMTWGSGFFDTWDNPGNQPSGSSHWVGVQAYHYISAANSGYGWQMCGGPIGNLRFRNSWPTNSGWKTIPVLDVNDTNGGTMYAGSYVAADDTGYYCDPNGTNRLNFVNSNNHYIQPGYMLYSDHGGWTGEYNKIQWHSSHLYLQNNGGGYLLILRRGDGGERFYCDYSGNVTASGNITAYSDRSLKENILTIQNPLQLVSKLRGVTFDWIETKKPSYGLIAQEVEQVIPELVLEIDTGTTETDSSKKIKTVDYGKMVSVLIEAIKEQQQQIDELKNLVKQLVQ